MSTQSPSRRSTRGRRRLLLALGVLVVLLLLAVVAVAAFVDAEAFRGPIERALADATGWQAELGEIDFSVLRGLVLTVSPASLVAAGDSSRFDISVVEIHAKLMPLLKGRLDVQSIVLDRPEINLVRASEAEGWILPRSGSGTVAPATPETGTLPTETGQEPPDETATPERGFSVVIDRVMVEDGRLRLEDRAAQSPHAVELESVSLSLSVATGELSGRGRLSNGAGRIEWSGDWNDRLRVSFAELPSEFVHPWIGDQLLHGGGTLEGEIEVGFPLQIDGALTGESVTLLAGDKPFEQEIRLDFKLQTGPEELRLERMRLQAAGVELVGGGALLPAVDLELRIPPAPLESVLRASESALPLPLQLSPPGTVEADIRVELPPGGELAYSAKGLASAAGFRPGELLPQATDVRCSFELSRDGELRVELLDGRVAGGPVRGAAVLDRVEPPGKLSLEGGIQDAVLGELLGSFLGRQATGITGPTGLAADIGLDLAAGELGVRALSGRLDLDSRQASLPGWDLEGAIHRTLEQKLGGGLASLLEQKLLGSSRSDTGTEEQSEGASADQIFDTMVVRVDFDSWPWKLDQLSLAAGGLSASGSGTFDPERGSVDLDLTSRLGPEKTASLVRKAKELRALVDSQGRLTLPIRVEGSFLRPSISVDLGRALTGKLGDEPEDALKGLLKDLVDRR